MSAAPTTPLRVVTLVLEAYHGEEGHDVGATARSGEYGQGCRFCTCTPGRHAREHSRIRYAINPGTIRAISPLIMGFDPTPTPGFCLVTSLIVPERPWIVEGDLDAVLESLSWPA